ncbi:MAG: hypothetical protein AAGI71_05045 [Bacteroidota bacterium]
MRLPLPLMARLLLGGLLLAGLTGCERPLIDVRPEVTVVAPDLEEVLPPGPLTLVVEAAPFLTRLEVDGLALTQDPESGRWRAALEPPVGLPTLVLTAFDGERVARVDTLTLAVDAPPGRLPGPALPEPRGGHTATLLPDGRVLVAGGAPSIEAEASPSAFVLDPTGERFQRLPFGLLAARTGHTATLLPDGRVLILGGSLRETPLSPDDLVSTVELFDPASARFTDVVMEGAPVRRTFHTASVRQTESGLFIDLYGGVGVVRETPPTLGTRGDVRTFALRENTLVAAGPDPGLLVDELWGHTQTALTERPVGAPGQYLVAGTFFAGDLRERVGLIFDWEALSLQVDEATPLRPDRTRHATVRLDDDRLLVTGGIDFGSNSVARESLLYVPPTEGVFRYPSGGPASVSRYGHTMLTTPATNAENVRILVVGGFQAAGTALSSSLLLAPTTR